MATPEQIITEWRTMRAGYPSSFVRATDDDITGNQLIWIEQLSDVDPDLLHAACANYRSSDSEWFPTAGKIRKMAFDLSNPNGHRTGLEAWGDVVAAFHHGGHWGIPEFSDPIVADVVKLLDWQTLCLSEYQTADRARFIAAYEAITDRRKTDALTLPEVRQVQQQIAGGNGKALAEIKRLANKMESKDYGGS